MFIIKTLENLKNDGIELNTIYCCDCLDGMKFIKKDSVDLIITDPPYFLPAQHYQTRKQFKRNFSDLGILEHFFKDFFNDIERVLKNTGHFYIFCDGQSYPLFYYYAYFFTKSVRPIIWDKIVSFNGYDWRHQHELILYGCIPSSKPIPTGDGDILKCRAVKVDDREHPAEKPVELIEKLINKHDEYDLILDPFIGSGTTAVACIRTNRNFIGMEISPEYCTIVERRILAERAQLKLNL